MYNQPMNTTKAQVSKAAQFASLATVEKNGAEEVQARWSWANEALRNLPEFKILNAKIAAGVNAEARTVKASAWAARLELDGLMVGLGFPVTVRAGVC